MTKLELTVQVSTLDCIACEGITADILGCKKLLEQQKKVHMSLLLSSLPEFQSFERTVETILKEKDLLPRHVHHRGSFSTMNLVFSAPGAEVYALASNRKGLTGVFASPMQAIHCCGEMELACFTHIELTESGDFLRITALEYSREYRTRMLQQEFGSWLLEEHIEKSVIATTMVGEIVFWNKFASKLYQYKKEEVLGRCVMEVISSKMTEEQGVEIMAALGEGKHWRGMFKVQRKDGSLFMAHVSDTPILDAAGTTKFIVGVSDDYTKLHNVMDELERLNQDLEKEVKSRTQQILEHETSLRMVGAAIKASDTGVLITDKAHKITWWNDAVLRMLSANADDLDGQTPWNISSLRDNHASSVEELKNFLKTALATQDEGDGQFISGTLDMLPVEALSVTVQRLADELKELHLVTFRDMTLHRKAADAQSRAEAAAAASESKTEMMQMLSHELRSPLQGILGVASSLLLDLSPEDSNLFDGASTIVASSRLLLTLIGNVLDFRKLELNMMADVDLGPVSVAACVEESVKYCLPFATCNDVVVSIDLGDHSNCTTPEIRLDSRKTIVTANRLRLDQVIVNLLTNSIKYTKPGTGVKVSLRRTSAHAAIQEARRAVASDLNYLDKGKLDALSNLSGDVVIVSVRDHGPGIPADESDKVFAAFVQLRISAEKDRNYRSSHSGNVGQSSGTGLGLNLSMKFLEKMHGHIWYKNCPSGGVEFSFSLPVSDAAAECLEQTETGDVHNTRLNEDDAKRFRVMIVDDTMINLKVLSRMVTRLGIRDVYTATSGMSALKMLRELEVAKLPNLIMSDLQMPEMSGEELVVHLRQLERTSNATIMACTADWTQTVEKRCQDAGFDGILRKPLTINDIEEFLVRKVSEDPDCKRFSLP